jgi:hypothetical protein
MLLLTKVEEMPVMTSSSKAMKGYELYSWYGEDAQWGYALLIGTNRLKSFEEITAPAAVISSVAELRSRLAQLPRSGEIVWIAWTDERLALPPEPVIESVIQACKRFGLQLTIAA